MDPSMECQVCALVDPKDILRGNRYSLRKLLIPGIKGEIKVFGFNPSIPNKLVSRLRKTCEVGSGNGLDWPSQDQTQYPADGLLLGRLLGNMIGHVGLRGF
jgi:hypothetical protein